MYEYLYDKLESGVRPTMEEFASAGIGEDEAEQILNEYGFDGGSDGEGFSGTTYEEAMAYMRSQGVPQNVTSAMMTESEWVAHKSSMYTGEGGTLDMSKGSNSAYNDVKYDTYAEYLRNYVNSQIHF